jgi:dihydropteroate synthase
MTTLLEMPTHSEKPWLMGVVNVTPDSFSDGGAFLSPQSAIDQAWHLARAGADVIDIGGESTGPGAEAVGAEEELRRIRPVVAALAKEMPLSVDTYKAEVAEFALRAGARMINDVSAVRADPEMAGVLKRHECLVVVMHSKESPDHPGATTSEKHYGDIVAEIAEFLKERIAFLSARGIDPRRIIVDPGMGRFLSGDPEHSWDVRRRLDELKRRLGGAPLLIGASRKGFLGGRPEGRDPLSQLAGLAAWLKGADIIRTHDVAMARDFLQAWRKLMPDRRPA